MVFSVVYSSFSFDKYRIREIKLLVPLNKENLSSFLSPILGQFGIKISDFLEELELNTDFLLSKDIVLPIRFIHSHTGKVQLEIFYPTIASLLRFFLLNSIQKVSFLDLYKIVLVKFYFYSFQSNSDLSNRLLPIFIRNYWLVRHYLVAYNNSVIARAFRVQLCIPTFVKDIVVQTDEEKLF